LAESLLLCFWLVVGACLRLNQLTAKSPWTDEFATLVFSAGNDYKSVPLNQVIPPSVLLQPLQPNSEAGIKEVISLLIHEDTHPPLYFILSHLWLKLFPLNNGYISLWGARSLAALFGVLAILAVYWLAKLAFESSTCAQIAAAMMAVSPYAIFLSQEARQYSLAVMFTSASLCCLTIAVKCLLCDRPIPVKLIFLWVGINSLGLTVHYFFSLTLAAEAIGLSFIVWHKFKPFFLYLSRFNLPSKFKNSTFAFKMLPFCLYKNLLRLGMVVAGTATCGLIWIFTILPPNYGTGMTEWIRYDRSTLLNLVNPIFQMLAAWITMLSLLPVEASSIPVVIISGLIMLLFFIWALPLFKRGLRVKWKCPQSRATVTVLVGFLFGAVALFFAITYVFSIDITRGARYNFVYFPAVIVLVAASLDAFWRREVKLNKVFGEQLLIWLSVPKTAKLFFAKKREKIAVILVWLMGFTSAIAVTSNLGYQKYYRPDLLIPTIEAKSHVPVLIATTHQTLIQTGEMMGIAWEMQNNTTQTNTNFVLIHQPKKYSPNSTTTLTRIVSRQQHPFDLWTVNFHAAIELNNCAIDSQTLPAIDGYSYSLYHCSNSML
jgi:uncharacterized membrane protein